MKNLVVLLLCVAAEVVRIVVTDGTVPVAGAVTATTRGWSVAVICGHTSLAGKVTRPRFIDGLFKGLMTAVPAPERHRAFPYDLLV